MKMELNNKTIWSELTTVMALLKGFLCTNLQILGTNINKKPCIKLNGGKRFMQLTPNSKNIMTCCHMRTRTNLNFISYNKRNGTAIIYTVYLLETYIQKFAHRTKAWININYSTIITLCILMIQRHKIYLHLTISIKFCIFITQSTHICLFVPLILILELVSSKKIHLWRNTLIITY